MSVGVLGVWATVTGAALVVRVVHERSQVWGSYATQLALICSACAAVAIYRRRHRAAWDAPLDELRHLYAEVRRGAAPIESLNAVHGAMTPVSRMVQELLHDLRSQEARVNELHEELRQRVAQRTELLERRIGSLKRQSTTDPLTGLQNRRRFDEVFPETVFRCASDAQDLCVMMIDVDYFKQLNDLKGHATGDEFLKAVGQLIRSSVRPDDEAYRLGGDEFCVSMPGMNLDAGREKALALSRLAERLAKSYKVPLPPKLSIGLSSLASVADKSAEGLLAAADKHLYEVKASRSVKSRAAG